MLMSTSLADQIRSVLLKRIVEGSYAPGERLVELKIAREFGVSQAPIREALRQLETIGFVESGERRGTYVTDFEHPTLQEVFSARGALEEAGTRLATPLLQGRVERLEAEIAAMGAAAERRDMAELEHHSVEFHRQVMRASRSKLLLKLWEALHIEEHTEITVALLAGSDLVALAESHRPLVEALRAGEVERACRLAREHQDQLIALVAARR